MAILDSIKLKAVQLQKRIVLPESEDQRMVDAASYILDHSIAKLVVVGKDEVRRKISSKNAKDLEVVDPQGFKDIEAYISQYYELRKAKGMTPEEARKAVREDALTFGALLVRNGYADGFVAGAINTSADVTRAALRCLSIDRKVGTIAGAFLMEVPDCQYGQNGAFIFADCGVNPDPNANQLAGIALASARLFEQLVGVTPRVAFLSYSSKGSGHGSAVDRVVEALKKARAAAPELLIDGEFQVDSAIVPEVAKIKCPDGGEVAGRANVLIFPDLNSGNISYKIVQRLAKARAIGPLFMGFTKVCSDLSRGCDAQDIVDAVAITAVRS